MTTREIVEKNIALVERYYPDLRMANRWEWTHKVTYLSWVDTRMVGQKSTDPHAPVSDDTIGIFSSPITGAPGQNFYPASFEAVDLVSGSTGAIQWSSYGIVNGQNFIIPTVADVSAIPSNPPTPNVVPYTPYHGDASNATLKQYLEFDYGRKPQGADFDVSVWAFRVQHSALMGPVPPSEGGQPLGMDAAVTKHRPEWCEALGVPVIPLP